MSDQQFITECERLLDAIEDAVDASELDVDFQRSGHVLELEFENGSKIVINGQAPMREMWLAAPSGAHHYRKNDQQRWVDTRSGEEFSAALSRCVSSQSGEPVVLKL